jgi:hypothetical protein
MKTLTKNKPTDGRLKRAGVSQLQGQNRQVHPQRRTPARDDHTYAAFSGADILTCCLSFDFYKDIYFERRKLRPHENIYMNPEIPQLSLTPVFGIRTFPVSLQGDNATEQNSEVREACADATQVETEDGDLETAAPRIARKDLDISLT